MRAVQYHAYPRATSRRCPLSTPRWTKLYLFSMERSCRSHWVLTWHAMDSAKKSHQSQVSTVPDLQELCDSIQAQGKICTLTKPEAGHLGCWTWWHPTSKNWINIRTGMHFAWPGQVLLNVRRISKMWCFMLPNVLKPSKTQCFGTFSHPSNVFVHSFACFVEQKWANISVRHNLSPLPLFDNELSLFRPSVCNVAAPYLWPISKLHPRFPWVLASLNPGA